MLSTKIVVTLIPAFAIATAAYAAKSGPLELGGVACPNPPAMHCPDANCGALVTEQGPAVEPKTGRKFFLDYPCDLKKGEKVTFILALHGGGSYGNWQRHYFPIVDYKDKYRLVIATPNAPPRVWASTDDEYLQNIVNHGLRSDRQEEHQGVLAGRALARRHDVEPDHPHRFLQAARGRMAEPVGRTAGRESGAREFRKFDGSTGGRWSRSRPGRSGRTRRSSRTRTRRARYGGGHGRLARTSRKPVLVHLRDWPA